VPTAAPAAMPPAFRNLRRDCVVVVVVMAFLPLFVFVIRDTDRRKYDQAAFTPND
jgi:hypothetical protein